MDKAAEVLPMMGGSAEISYAANSKHQKQAILASKLLAEEAVKDVYTKTQADIFVVADLGCSFGPNTFLLHSIIIQALAELCHELGQKPPEIQCFLNDLPENDFNTLFQSLESLEMKLLQNIQGAASVPNYYVAGLPGTFYGRLFPSSSVHFFHSSFCLHWCSKVPDGVRSEEGVALNKKNIHIASTSTPNTIKSYYEQFKSDFSNFLDLRFKELVPRGRMVLSFLGRKSLDARFGESSYLFSLLADALDSMVQQGLIEEGKIDTFYIPNYMPSLEEARELIIKQGTFSINRIYTVASSMESNYDFINDHEQSNHIESGKNVAKIIKAVYGPLLSRQFGSIIMDELFSRFTINVTNHLPRENRDYTIIFISLLK